MSYDYLLFRPPGEGPMSTWPAVAPEPPGTFSDVAARLEEIFPGLSWGQPRASAESWSGQWQGDGAYMSVRLNGSEGLVRFVTMSRAERPEVERVADRLGLVALDSQKMELYRPGRRAWTSERGPAVD